MNKLTQAIQSARESVRATAADVAMAGRSAAFTVETKTLAVRDAALDKVGEATGAAVKVCNEIAGTAALMIEIGVVVAAIVAPVPTAVGVGLLWLLERQMKHAGDLVDSAAEEERSGRKLERITGLIKKYGQIPETATLETDCVTMAINSKTGEVSGQVLEGEFKGCELSSLSSEDLDRMIEFVRDDGTKGILVAYQSLRQTRDQASRPQ